MATPKPKSNPFEGMEVAFAADLKPITYPFKMMGADCFVTVRGMDAGANREHRALILQCGEIDGGGQVSADLQRVPLAELEMHLLLSCVIDFALPTLKEVRGEPGKTVPEVTTGAGLAEAQKRTVFAGLTPEMFEVLLDLCNEVNVSDPLGGGRKIPA